MTLYQLVKRAVTNVIGGIVIPLASSLAQAQPALSPVDTVRYADAPKPDGQPAKRPDKPSTTPSSSATPSTLPSYVQAGVIAPGRGSTGFGKGYVGINPAGDVHIGIDGSIMGDVRDGQGHVSGSGLVELLHNTRSDANPILAGLTAGWLFNENGHHAKVAAGDNQFAFGAVARDTLGNYLRALLGVGTDERTRPLFRFDGQLAGTIDQLTLFAGGNYHVLFDNNFNPQHSGFAQAGFAHTLNVSNDFKLSLGLKGFMDFMERNAPIYGGGIFAVADFNDALLTAGFDINTHGPFVSSGRDPGFGLYAMLTVPLDGKSKQPSSGRSIPVFVPFRREYFARREDAGQPTGTGGGTPPPDIPPFGNGPQTRYDGKRLNPDHFNTRNYNGDFGRRV